MPDLLPFRDYSEHDVINLYSCDIVANKGVLVKPIRSPQDSGGSDSSTAGPLKLGSDRSGGSFTNSINNLFDIVGQVTPVVNYNDAPAPIGVLLLSVKEVDENGEKLIFNPRKAAEMNVVLPKINAVPILTKGIIRVNDIDTTNRGGGGGNPDIGDFAYVGDSGKIGTDGVVVIGKFLSKKDENGYCLVKLSM
jgi:hypothetical protein